MTKTYQKQPVILINKETGEYIKTIDAADRIIPRNILDRLREEIPDDKIYVNLSRGFVKFFGGISSELQKFNLSGNDLLIMLYLAENTRMGSGACLYNNNRPITKENIAKEFNICQKTASKTIANLTKAGIIAIRLTENKLKMFFNPYLFMRGRYINKTLYQMFNDTYWFKIGRNDKNDEL